MRRYRWTEEKIKEGFDRFKSEYGRLPKAVEIDGSGYLPSSRFIQKAYGGLERLRARLGYDYSHFGKGAFRSEIANRVNVRGRKIELSLEKILREKFGEVFVHTEKIFDGSKNRIDFFIYSPDGNFGIDVFYPDTMRTLQSNINIKMGKYSNFHFPLFYVVANKKFKQEELDAYTRSKIRFLPITARIVTLDALLDILKASRVYPDPKVISLKI